MASAPPPAKRARTGDGGQHEHDGGDTGTGTGCLAVHAFTAAEQAACPALGWADDGASLLAPFCWPLSPEAFLARHWDVSRAFATRGAPAARVAALARTWLHGLDLGALLARTPSATVFAWVRHDGAKDGEGGRVDSFGVEDVGEARAWHAERGASLYFRAPARRRLDSTGPVRVGTDAGVVFHTQASYSPYFRAPARRRLASGSVLYGTGRSRHSLCTCEN